MAHEADSAPKVSPRQTEASRRRIEAPCPLMSATSLRGLVPHEQRKSVPGGEDWHE